MHLFLIILGALAFGAFCFFLGAAAFMPRIRFALSYAVLAGALFLPALAHADAIGSIVLGAQGGTLGLVIGAAFGLASMFHVGDIIVGWVKAAKAPQTTIAGHPKLTEGLDALESAGTHLVQDLVNAHPDLGNVLIAKLKTDSFSAIGLFLVTNYGPELMADLLKQGKQLLGVELALVFGGQKATEDAAVNRLGVAASNVAATLKAKTVLADGRTVVSIAPQPA